MSWSARELGELAGTSRRTVRHYQDMGLLTEPERSSNGYQHYDVTHLVRLLRIRRLVELGLPLAMVRDLDEADTHPVHALTSLRTELDADIGRLRRLREELDLILEHAAPVDLPVDLAAATRELSLADRSLTVVLSRVLSPVALQVWRQLLGQYARTPVVEAFDALTEESDEHTRASVAAGLATQMRSLATDLPGTMDAIRRDLAHRPAARRSVDAALDQLYNDAQFEALRLASAELTEDWLADDPGPRTDPDRR